MAGFQKTVNLQPAPAVEGNFASSNPRFSALTVPGGYVSGVGGVTVGRFCWADPYGDQQVLSHGSGAPLGFIANELQAMIVSYLAETSMNVQPGYMVTPYNGGDFWVKNAGVAVATIGMKAYASFTDGSITFAPTATPPQQGSVTGSIAAVSAISVTASIAAPPTGSSVGSVMTVTAVGSGTVVIGGTLSGTGVTTGTKVVSQISGTPGGIGTYGVDTPQTVAATTITEAAGVLTVTAVGSGSVGVGSLIAGGTTSAGTIITALGTGTGGLGTYIVNNSQVVTSGTLTATSAIETKWVCLTAGGPGELVKMSDHPNG
jgi:hypothetical protein